MTRDNFVGDEFDLIDALEEREAELERQLVESRALVAALRKALEGVAAADYDGAPLCWCDDDYGDVHERGCRLARAAFALPDDATALEDAVKVAVEAERDACAKVAETYVLLYSFPEAAHLGQIVAGAIRERGQG